jgi:hypothetical protein
VYRHKELIRNNVRDFGSDDEKRLNRLIEKHFEMLSACPIDLLIAFCTRSRYVAGHVRERRQAFCSSLNTRSVLLALFWLK